MATRLISPLFLPNHDRTLVQPPFAGIASCRRPIERPRIDYFFVFPEGGLGFSGGVLCSSASGSYDKPRTTVGLFDAIKKHNATIAIQIATIGTHSNCLLISFPNRRC